MLLRAILSILLLLEAFQAMADGMSFQVIGASADVSAGGQRAVLWLRDGNWELHIQPVFDRQAGAAAWVVPFPVRPEVHPGDADFFDELEILTAPVFMKVCETSNGGHWSCFGCMGSDAGRLGTEQHGEAFVHLWEHGTVGDLDYSIVSAADGESLVAWLQDEGYAAPDGLAAILVDYETEGEFFFAARLSSEADPAKPLAPVRFVLPGMADPAYPLRMTALGVAAGQGLELTLWVIFPGQTGATAYLPANRNVVVIDGNPEDAPAFEAALDKLYESHPDSLVALFGDVLNGRSEQWGTVCSGIACVSFEELGIKAPAVWSQPVQEIFYNPFWVSRYQARLSATAMASDLIFEKGDRTNLQYLDRVYVKYTCDEELAGIGWLLVLAAGLGLLRRMLCNRKKRAPSA
ncbi:MAG TPA: DUF2330 domain-containing protein [Myxococcota bacterium]|nr:DUF2330 domain-containing protein [Myxococcota bacterium]